MKRDFGFISVGIVGGAKGKTLNGDTIPKMKQIKVEVFSRFNYRGHNFIIHRPRNSDEGYVCSHDGLGFLVSEPKTDRQKIEAVKKPTAYTTVQQAKQATIQNIECHISNGYDFDKTIENVRPLLVKAVGYMELRLKNILQ